jgi:competence ComEA-like helix-hairpin-helix protein
MHTETRNNLRRISRFSAKRYCWQTALLFAVPLLISLMCVNFAHAQKKHPPAKPLDLNSASIVELQQVPGIGPATAKAIVNFREKSGPFLRVEDILAIHGVSKQSLERMRPYLVVKPPEIPTKKMDSPRRPKE